MTILVTGASGHLGEALVRTLKEGGQTVRGLDIIPSSSADIVGSVTDASLVRQAMEGVSAVLHTATLHKPHVATHPARSFVDVNVGGTLNLLEAARDTGVGAFVVTSTTSVFGAAMALAPGAREAVWVDENLAPVPKNIYGVTKRAAEDLCQLFHRRDGLNCLVLRTSRFFPEQDDNAERRGAYADDNLKANELLFRRADLADMVSAHQCALERAPELGFGRFIISADSPFDPADRAALLEDAPAVVERCFPGFRDLYREAGWRMFPAIGRVYDSRRARQALGWTPRYDFAHVLDCLRRGEDFASPLARAVGSKGYHDEVFREGPFPVEAGGQARDGGDIG